MIRLLILVQVFDIVASDIPSPLEVEVGVVALHHIEASMFARIYYSVVDVCCVCDFKSHEEVLDLVTVVFTHTVSGPLQVHVTWVREESRRRPIGKNRLEKVDVLRVWFENTVRQACFLALNENWIDWVVLNELRDLLKDVLLRVLWHFSLLSKHVFEALQELAVQELHFRVSFSCSSRCSATLATVLVLSRTIHLSVRVRVVADEAI